MALVVALAGSEEMADKVESIQAAVVADFAGTAGQPPVTVAAEAEAEVSAGMAEPEAAAKAAAAEAFSAMGETQ